MKNIDAYDSLLNKHKLRKKAITMFWFLFTFVVLFILFAILTYFIKSENDLTIYLSI